MRTQVFFALVGMMMLLSLAPVAAQEPPGTEQPFILAPECGGGSIPDPSEGCAPQTPGDPGGWQQLTLLAIVLTSIATIGLLVRRQLRQATRLREIEVDPNPS